MFRNLNLGNIECYPRASKKNVSLNVFSYKEWAAWPSGKESRIDGGHDGHGRNLKSTLLRFSGTLRHFFCLVVLSKQLIFNKN